MWTFLPLSPDAFGERIERSESVGLVLGEVQGSASFVWERATPLERRVLLAMFIGRPVLILKHQHVKIRCVDLQPNDYTCANYQWHIDCVETPDGPGRPEQHVLYVTGGAPTEFLRRELSMIERPVHLMRNRIRNQEPEGVAAPMDRLVWYGRMNLHRGPLVTAPCRRLLIRTTWTDTVRLANRSTR